MALGHDHDHDGWSSIRNPKGPSTQLSYTLKTSNLHNYSPKPEYLTIGSFGPLGKLSFGCIRLHIRELQRTCMLGCSDDVDPA